MSKITPAWYARTYTERFGFHLVPIQPLKKFPQTNDWGKNCLSDPDAAEDFYARCPEWNMGLALGPSRMCSLDVDDLESFKTIMFCLGQDLDAVIAESPTIKGSGYRITFRVPDGIDLPYRSLSWPSKNDPSGDKHRAAMRIAMELKKSGNTEREARVRAVAKRWAKYTVFELRASSVDGQQRQDVLPPSIHPDTMQPYVWVTKPRDDWPTPPDWLMDVWVNFQAYEKQLKVMCPWVYEPEKILMDKPAPAKKYEQQKNGGVNVIDEYNAAVPLTDELHRFGYSLVSKNRWISPHSSTGLPGVFLFSDHSACWIHHASDPLCSDQSGHPVSAFDLLCYYDHNDDVSSAVKAAAKMLGLNRPRVVDNRASQPSVIPLADIPVDDDFSYPAIIQDEPLAHDEPKPLAVAGSGDFFSPLPWTNDKGKPLKHIENISEICKRLGVVVRYNVITKDEEILIPDQAFSRDNRACASLAWIVSECSKFDMPTDRVPEFMTFLADKNQYNPVTEWIGSRPWDGVSRLQSLYDTIVARGESDPKVKWLKESLIKRWLISAVAAAYSPNGISAQGVLVLQGDQNLGKTSWIKSLVPEILGVFREGALLRPDDKDSVKQACSNWIVELGELDATFSKADIAMLKAFITKDSDVLRMPFSRKESHFARRTVFFGSVNPNHFLQDKTGNRRFWTIGCESVNARHGLDVQQLWAEVAWIWMHGESYYLLPDELAALNDANDEFMALDPLEDLLASKFAWDSPAIMWEWKTTVEILYECGIDRPSKADSMTIATHIKKLNGGQVKRSNGKKLFLRPPTLNSRVY